MRRRSPVIVALLLLPGWRVLAAAEGDLVDAGALAPAGLVKYWQCPVPLHSEEAIVDLYLEDENLYALTDLGALHTIDADVGLVRWSAPITDPPFRIFRPCHARTKDPAAAARVYVASPTDLVVFHRRTGRLLAKMKLPFTPSGPPIADKEYIYIGSVNNRYYALRAVKEGLVLLEPKKKGLKWYAVVVLSDGKRLYAEAETLAKARDWQQSWVQRLGGLQSERRAAMVRWQIDTEGNVKGRPAVADRIAYIPSDGGKLFACALFGKRKHWTARATGGILADPIIGRGMVYFASTGRSVYAVDRVHGTRQWQCHLPVPLKRTGHLMAKRLYQPGEPTGVYAIDPLTGKLQWVFERAAHFLAEHAETVYLLEPGQAIHQVDTRTGRALRSMPCPGATLCVGNTRDTTLYIASADGRLMCIRPKGVPYLRRAQFERAMAGPPGPRTTGNQIEKPGQSPAKPAAVEKPTVREIDDPLRSRGDEAPAVDAEPGTADE